MTSLLAGDKASALQQIAKLAARFRLEPDEVLAALPGSDSANPVERTSGVLARVLAYLGGVLILAGIALFIGLKWETFVPAVRVLVTLGSGFALYLIALATLSDHRFERVTTPLLLVAALLQPTGVLVLLDEYAPSGQPEHDVLLVCAAMWLQQFLTFLARRRTTLLFTSLFFGTVGLGTALDLFLVDGEIIAIALGIGLLTICYWLDSTLHRGITPFWYFIGALLLLCGSFSLLESTPFESAFFALAAGVMYLATLVRSRTLLLVSVISMMSFTGYFFRESLTSAIGLIFIGALLIVLSALAMKINSKYIARDQVYTGRES